LGASKHSSPHFTWRSERGQELIAFDGPIDKYLHGKNPIWNRMGRVCFHLAENKRDEEAPFAFVATYTARLSSAAKVQHLPLAEALREYAGARNKAALLSLLAPVQKAAETSDLAGELVDTGAIYHPLRWTPREAYRFLKDTGAFKASGVVVRVPDFWKGKHPPQPEARLTVGGKPKTGLGADALLDFSVGVVLDGETLGARSAGRVAIEDGAPAIRAAESWREMHEALAAKGSAEDELRGRLGVAQRGTDVGVGVALAGMQAGFVGVVAIGTRRERRGADRCRCRPIVLAVARVIAEDGAAADQSGADS